MTVAQLVALDVAEAGPAKPKPEAGTLGDLKMFAAMRKG